MKQTEDLKVLITTAIRIPLAISVERILAMVAWITLVEGKGALCLACADLDNLISLPSGNTAAGSVVQRQAAIRPEPFS